MVIAAFMLKIASKEDLISRGAYIELYSGGREGIRFF